MRKILMSIIVGLLLIWTIYFMVKGSDAIGVKGFLGLKEKNEMIENEISTLDKTINNDFSGALLTLDSEKDNLIDTKTEYENQAALTSLNNTRYTAEKFDIDLLWTRLGNFAKDENVVIKMDVVQSTDIDVATNTDTEKMIFYDLDFTVSGTYDGITNFIYDIEKDETLGFKIDNFQMAGTGETIEAYFECRGIGIDFGENKQVESSIPTNITDKLNPQTSTTNTNIITGTSTTTETNTTNTNTTTETSTKNETSNAKTTENGNTSDNPSSLLDEYNN